MPAKSNPSLDIIHQRCIDEYNKIVCSNPKIDAGHSVNHVIKVETWTSRAIHEFLEIVKTNDNSSLRIDKRTNDDLDFPSDVLYRIKIASLLHEVGDYKFDRSSSSILSSDNVSNTAAKTFVKTKEELISEILSRVLYDYSLYSLEMVNDIITIIDLCSASKWGNRIPEGTKLYQLIPRWADRLEATGYIGIIRTLLYTYKKMDTQPLCLDTDDFPSSVHDLHELAPYSRWELYTLHNKKSVSGYSHFLDKIIHINGDDVPLPILREELNKRQLIIQSFVLEFVIKNNKRYDIDELLANTDGSVYGTEVSELRRMQQELREQNCRWIK